ncbi:MAG: NAD-dependent epimerase/dehydratase family protein [Hadesarchaea archaeon]|nr:NAD-dependent epimerase/dehydratase family protein [Hadesarchaea archaeon]
MRVLVTGGAGFIGSNLVEALVGRGDDVTVLDNFSTGTVENLEKVRDRVKTVQGSCTELLELKLQPELIFHLGIPSSSPMYRENPLLVGEAISGFMNVMELAKQNQAKVVYASSSSMYRGCPRPNREDVQTEPFDYYTEARLAMERLARVYHQFHGVSSAGLRFFSVYGPHERAKGRYANIITQMILNDEFTIFGDGSQTRDFTHVDDIVRALVLAAGKTGAFVFNVGTGRETSFNEVAKLIQEIKPLKIKYLPNPLENYVERTQADISLVKRELSWAPTVKLEDGIRRTVDYYGEARPKKQ